MIKIDKVKYTKDIKKIVKSLDDEISFFTCVDISWYDRYSSESYIYLLKDDEDIVGYLHGSYITKKLYDSFLNGEIINDYLIDKKEYLNNSNYIYIDSVVIKEKYRNKKYGSLLSEMFLNDNNDKKIVALTISKLGFKLFKKYFKLYKNIDEKHNIFIN